MIPLHAPLHEGTVVPYSCAGLRTLSVICEGNEEEIKRILSYTPFQYVTNKFVVSICDFSNTISDFSKAKDPYWDVGVVVPTKFRDVTGGFYMYEYEDKTDSVIGGRELWGYPKRHGTAKLIEKGDRIEGEVERLGVKIIEAEMTVTGEEVPTVETYPHLLLRVIPQADGPGILMRQVVSRDTSPDFVTKSRKTGKATLKFGKLDSDPMHKLGPTKVLGATYVIGDFFATEKHGYAKVLL